MGHANKINKEAMESAQKRIKEVLIDLKSPTLTDFVERQRKEKAT